MHRLADDSSRSIGPERGAPIAPARVRRLPGPFELHVHTRAVGRDLLAEQDGAAITEAREVPELVAGICLGERRLRPRGRVLPAKIAAPSGDRGPRRRGRDAVPAPD
jgi:hypothetical protein